MNGTDEARRWLDQARIDLEAAEANRTSFPYVECFLAQQAAEKAMKEAIAVAASVVSAVERIL